MPLPKKHIDYDSKIESHKAKLAAEQKIIEELEQKRQEQDIYEISSIARSSGISISDCRKLLEEAISKKEN